MKDTTNIISTIQPDAQRVDALITAAKIVLGCQKAKWDGTKAVPYPLPPELEALRVAVSELDIQENPAQMTLDEQEEDLDKWWESLTEDEKLIHRMENSGGTYEADEDEIVRYRQLIDKATTPPANQNEKGWAQCMRSVQGGDL